jgi:hypothetical protein
MSAQFDSKFAAYPAAPRPRLLTSFRLGRALRRLSLSGVLLTALLLGGSFLVPQDAAASGICSGSLGDPRPPSGQPDPMIGGSVTNAATNSPVPSTLVKLYRCDGTTATLAKTTTTNNSGQYSFGSLTNWKWYYVDVPLTGPLSNMLPASGTNNPSAAQDVGPGNTNLNFAFTP